MKKDEAVECLQQDIAIKIFYIDCYEVLKLIADIIVESIKEQ